MSEKLLYGIQQVGIGVTNVLEAEKWYHTRLKAAIKVLEDHNPATHMAPYMGGKARQKSAVILLNPNGGGGFELWQHTEHTPAIRSQEMKPGDLGVNYITLHTGNLSKFQSHLSKWQTRFSIVQEGEILIQDPFGNSIHIRQNDELSTKILVTGIKECCIGVSDLKKSIVFYQNFGYQESVTNESKEIKSSILFSKQRSLGRFGKFFGDSQITLVQRKDQLGAKIYANRYWGDPGFIHLCFDVYNLTSWVQHFSSISPFTILSSENFKMGEAQGYWGYLEDPDETLIEMVEAHHIPIIKKLGFIIHLQKKSPHKSVPKWLIQAMKLKKARH